MTKNFNEVNFSDLVRQNLKVAAKVKEEVYRSLDETESINDTDLRKIINKVAKEIALEEGVEVSTINDAITRKIDADMDTYQKELKGWLLDETDSLIERVVDNCRIRKDSPVEVRTAFQGI